MSLTYILQKSVKKNCFYNDIDDYGCFDGQSASVSAASRTVILETSIVASTFDTMKPVQVYLFIS